MFVIAVVDGQPMSGSLFDFGLYFYHNAKELLSRGSGPYFYLPKMESHLEARLWNNVFNFAQVSPTLTFQHDLELTRVKHRTTWTFLAAPFARQC